MKALYIAGAIFVWLFMNVAFWLPDSWIYIHKGCDSVYNPLWHAWAVVASFLYGVFAGAGIFLIFKNLYLKHKGTCETE